MKNLLLKLLGSAALLALAALPASANSVDLTLNSSGTIGISSTGSGNLTLCLGGGSCNSLSATGAGTGDFAGITSFAISAGGPISLTETSNCVFLNSSLTGITFVGGDISGTFSSMTVSQTSSQVTSGVASLSGKGFITSVAGLTVNVPFDFSGVLHVGANVDICALPGGGTTGGLGATPEPGTLALGATGLLLLGGAVRLRFAL